MKRARCLLGILILVLVILYLSGKPGPDNKITPVPDSNTIINDLSRSDQSLWAKGEFVVDFKDQTTWDEIRKLEEALGVNMEYVSPHSKKARIMRGYAGDNISEVLARLKSDPRVEYAEPDYYYHIFDSDKMANPNDPFYKYQWNFEKINVRDAWNISRGDGVTVAVIDTGVAFRDHGRFHRLEDLENTRFVKGYDFIHNNNLPLDDHGHGSHVAGTIAQSTNNGKGVAGIAYNARIMPLKVLSANGYGRTSDIADAVRYAADNGAQVINMSLGGSFPSLVLKSACDYAWKKGVVIVCAAGNSSTSRPSYPAAFSSCLSVSATRYDDKLAPYSNRGPFIDIAAPGGDTTVDQNNDGKPDGIMQNTIMIGNPEKEGYYIFQGTSMASPHVAGIAAMLISAGVGNNREVVSILKKTARRDGLPLKEGYGAGIVDARKALIHATVNRGWMKLGVAIIVVVVLILLLGSTSANKIIYSPLFYISWLFGSTGLFFLPAIIAKPFPGMELLTRGFTRWDFLISGPGPHNPLFLSILAPVILSVLLYKTPWQNLAAGFTTGVAGAILWALLFSRADVAWIPGTLILDKLWLIINFAGGLFLAYLVITPGEKKQCPGEAE